MRYCYFGWAQRGHHHSMESHKGITTFGADYYSYRGVVILCGAYSKHNYRVGAQKRALLLWATEGELCLCSGTTITLLGEQRGYYYCTERKLLLWDTTGDLLPCGDAINLWCTKEGNITVRGRKGGTITVLYTKSGTERSTSGHCSSS